MRAIKFAVIAMGVLLVAGFVTLVVGFVQLMAPSDDTRPDGSRSNHSLPAVVELSVADLLLDRLGAPVTSRVISLATVDDRLVILIDLPDGEQRVFTVDPDLLLGAGGDGPASGDDE